MAKEPKTYTAEFKREAVRLAQCSGKPIMQVARDLGTSDTSIQYTSNAYRALLTQTDAMVSMSRKGNCYDNAVIESFFGTLKSECITNTCFESRAQARQAIFEYTECFYNRMRRHPSLGYLSPVTFEQLMC